MDNPTTKWDEIIDDLEHIVNGAEDLEWDANKLESNPLRLELREWALTIQDQSETLYNKYVETQKEKS